MEEKNDALEVQELTLEDLKDLVFVETDKKGTPVKEPVPFSFITGNTNQHNVQPEDPFTRLQQNPPEKKEEKKESKHGQYYYNQWLNKKNEFELENIGYLSDITLAASVEGDKGSLTFNSTSTPVQEMINAFDFFLQRYKLPYMLVHYEDVNNGK